MRVEINFADTPHMYAHPVHFDYAQRALEAGVITEEQLHNLGQSTEAIFAGRHTDFEAVRDINAVIHKHALKNDAARLKEEIYLGIARLLKIKTYEIGDYGPSKVIVDNDIYVYDYEFYDKYLALTIQKVGSTDV